MNIRKEHSCCYKCVPPKRHIGCHADCPDWDKLQAQKQIYEENEKQNRQVDIYYRDKTYKQESGKHATRWKIRSQK